MQTERTCHEHPNIDCSSSVGSPDFTLGRAVFSRIYRKYNRTLNGMETVDVKVNDFLPYTK